MGIFYFPSDSQFTETFIKAFSQTFKVPESKINHALSQIIDKGSIHYTTIQLDLFKDQGKEYRLDSDR